MHSALQSICLTLQHLCSALLFNLANSPVHSVCANHRDQQQCSIHWSTSLNLQFLVHAGQQPSVLFVEHSFIHSPETWLLTTFKWRSNHAHSHPPWLWLVWQMASQVIPLCMPCNLHSRTVISSTVSNMLVHFELFALLCHVGESHAYRNNGMDRI